MPKVLLFDFDGTIADSFEGFLLIVDELADKYKVTKLSREELEHFRLESAGALIKKLHIPLHKIPLLARDMKNLQRERITDLKPFPQLPEVLRSLKKQGYILGILTSNGEDNVRKFLKQSDLDIFDYIYSDSGLFGKDKALRSFLKKHGFSVDEVFYIGDEIRDIEACRKVGVKIIAVTWGFNVRKGLIKYKPDFIIDTIQELPKTLASVSKR